MYRSRAVLIGCEGEKDNVTWVRDPNPNVLQL